MPIYNPLEVDGAKFGVNLGRDADDLQPGEAIVADNVEFFGDDISQRNGYRNAYKGSSDAAYHGAAPSNSIYLIGEEWWLDTPYQMRKARFNVTAPPGAFETEGRRDFFNQRPGFIVIPEGNTPGLRLDVQAADTNWAIEFCFECDALPVINSTDVSIDPANAPLMKTIVAQKGFGTNGQWAVRLIPDATSTDRFYAVLTLYEAGALGNGAGTPAGVDFFYSNAAARAWIEPGKRVIVGWKFIDSGGGGDITSYYRIEGQSSVVSSSQNVNATSATLRTNGVGTGTYPLTIGRRPYQAAGRTGIGTGGAGRYIDEIGFLGSVSEMRFWWAAAQGVAGTLELPSNWMTVTNAPPASTDWYVESEIPQEQLSTVDAGTIVGTTDLQLYYQFKPELVGANPDGTTNTAENHRFIRPVYTRGTATDNIAWLTGSDATWLAGTGALGTFCLGMVPAGPTGSKYAYADVMRSGNQASYFGQRLFTGGLRVPNSNAYLQRAATGTTGYQFPDELAVRMSWRCDGLSSAASAYPQTLFELCVARQGAGPNQDRYACLAIMRAQVIYNGANWVYQFRMLDGAGAATTMNSTVTVVEGQIDVVEVAVKYDSAGNRLMSLYVNGNRENTALGVASKPLMSQASATDSTLPNADNLDGRDANFPFVVGYSVETTTAAQPSPWNWRYGAFPAGIAIGQLGESRAYWAFSTNDTLKQPNDGIGYRGHNPIVGVIGDMQVWQKYPGEGEAREMATRPPTAEEIQRDGSKLLSDWEFNEGQGTVAYDKGYLKNHLRINPLPTTLIASGICDRVNKPPMLGMFQKRQTSTGGAVQQQVYAMTPGVIHKTYIDGSSRRFLKPIGKCQTPEMWEPTNTSVRLPTTFQYSGAIYVCTGRGAVKRIFNDSVSDAGLTPYYGDIGDDQTNLGWRESDRDGMFYVYDLAEAANAAETVFSENVKYGWIVTPYDPITGIEGAPGRPVYLTIVSAGLLYGWKSVILNLMPVSPQRQVARRRVYRTTGNGGVFKFVGEMSADQSTFVDSVLDTKLQFDLTSWKNFPPPMNARIGLAFNARAIYFGCDDRPDTLFYSMEGNPGAVPKEYQITISSGQSTELTGGLIVNDRAILMTRTSSYVLFDAGGDISNDSPNTPPVQIAPMRDDVGCISHHGIAAIEGYGTIIPTERGPFLFDGNGFQPLGGIPDDRVMAFWQQLDLANSKNFVAVAHRRKRQWIFFCSLVSDASGGRNTRAIVFDWGRNAFSFHTNRDVMSASVIVDETTGQERIFCGTYTGDIFEFDPPDADLYSDGPEVAPFSGTIQDRKLDPLGSGKYTRLKLVTNSSLAVTGNGLRGMNLYTTNAGTQWHTKPLKILWNDANWVLIEAGAANTTDPNGFEWRLGAIASNWKSGRMGLGSSVMMKRVLREQVTFDPAPATGTLYANFYYDRQAAQSKTLDPSNGAQTFAGLLGRGRRIQLQFQTDKVLYGGLPNNPWSIPFLELNYTPSGSGTFGATT